MSDVAAEDDSDEEWDDFIATSPSKPSAPPSAPSAPARRSPGGT